MIYKIDFDFFIAISPVPTKMIAAYHFDRNTSSCKMALLFRKRYINR